VVAMAIPERGGQMDVLYDYFRAPSVAVLRKELAERGSGPLMVAGPESPVFDGVELEGIAYAVVLGQLIAFATDQPWNPELIGDRLIWPEDREQDAQYDGPWVVVLDDQVRDTLAEIPPPRLAELAERRPDIATFAGAATPADLCSAADVLIGLAARARTAGESLYCWMSL
jgi:hypothetical protein